MNIIFLGQLNASTTRVFSEQGITLVNTFPLLINFESFMKSPGVKMPVDAVMVTASAFDKSSPIIPQISLLQDCVRMFNNKPTLLVFFTKASNSLYEEVFWSGVLEYHPSNVKLLHDLQIKDMIEELTGKPIQQAVKTLARLEFEHGSNSMKVFDAEIVGTSPFDRFNDTDTKTTASVIVPQPGTPSDKVEEVKSNIINNFGDKYSPPIGVDDSNGGRLIVVCSLLPGSGSTFIGTNICWQLSFLNKTSSLIEHPENEPILLSLLGEKRNAPSNWSSIASKIKSSSTLSKRDYWKENNIVWFPLDKSDYGITLTAEEQLGFFVATKVSQFSFVDISTNWDSSRVSQVLKAADEIWCVVTPNKKIELRMEEFKIAMHEHSKKVVFVGNRFSGYSLGRSIGSDMNSLIQTPNSSVYGKAWSEAYLQYQIQEFDSSKVQKAEWSDTSVSKMVESQLDARNVFFDLLKRLAPNVVQRKIGGR